MGGAILGLAEITTDPRGDPDVSAPLEKTAPTASQENVQVVPVVKSEMNGVVGGSKKRSSKYAIFVKKIMAERGVKLPEASKYIKDSSLYKK